MGGHGSINHSMSDAAKLDALLKTIIQTSAGISDVLFVPGKRPQIEVYGELETTTIEWPAPPNDAALIESFARVIIDGNPKLLRNLEEHGACDCSYTLKDECRFRINIYRQKKNFAMVLRQLKPLVPSIKELGPGTGLPRGHQGK
jgi:twitching motility protein PilT